MIVTHGWPGSVIEQLKIIEPLTNPTAHGGTEADAFNLVIPSMPGYGFSARSTATAQWRSGSQPVSVAAGKAVSRHRRDHRDLNASASVRRARWGS